MYYNNKSYLMYRPTLRGNGERMKVLVILPHQYHTLKWKGDLQ